MIKQMDEMYILYIDKSSQQILTLYSTASRHSVSDDSVGHVNGYVAS